MDFVIIIIIDYIHATGPTKSKILRRENPSFRCSNERQECQSSFVGFYRTYLVCSAKSAPNQLLCSFHSLSFHRCALQATDLYNSAASRSSTHLKLIKTRSVCDSGSVDYSWALNLCLTIERMYEHLTGCTPVASVLIQYLISTFSTKMPSFEMTKKKTKKTTIT